MVDTDKEAPTEDRLYGVKMLYGAFTTVTLISLGFASVGALAFKVRDKEKAIYGKTELDRMQQDHKAWKAATIVSAGLFVAELLGAKFLDTITKKSTEKKANSFTGRIEQEQERAAHEAVNLL